MTREICYVEGAVFEFELDKEKKEIYISDRGIDSISALEDILEVFRCILEIKKEHGVERIIFEKDQYGIGGEDIKEDFEEILRFCKLILEFGYDLIGIPEDND